MSRVEGARPEGLGEKTELEYDGEADAAYIKLSTKPIRYTEQISPKIIIDFDGRGKPVGLEILAFKRPDLSVLSEIYQNNLKELVEFVKELYPDPEQE